MHRLLEQFMRQQSHCFQNLSRSRSSSHPTQLFRLPTAIFAKSCANRAGAGSKGSLSWVRALSPHAVHAAAVVLLLKTVRHLLVSPSFTSPSTTHSQLCQSLCKSGQYRLKRTAEPSTYTASKRSSCSNSHATFKSVCCPFDYPSWTDRWAGNTQC